MNSGNLSKKRPLRENVGHRGDINRCWYLVTSGRRTPEGEGERSQMIGWDPKTEVGLPPSAEVNSKKAFEQGSWQTDPWPFTPG